MKEYKADDGLTVREYDFEDWKNGVISGEWMPGKRKVENTTTKEVFYDYLPAEQYHLIQNERVKIYWEKVDEELNRMKKRFEQTLSRSGNTERLILTEIDKYEYIFFPETRQNKVAPGEMKLYQASTYSTLYQRLIVKGEKDYSIINNNKAELPVKDTSIHISVEAWAKFLNWLKTLKKGQNNPPQIMENFNRFISELKTIEYEILDSKPGIKLAKTSDVYRDQLHELKNAAVTDTLNVSKEQAERQIKRLDNIEVDLIRCRDVWKEGYKLHKNSPANITWFIVNIATKFESGKAGNREENKGGYLEQNLDNETLMQIRDIIGTKHACLSGLRDEVLKVFRGKTKNENTFDEIAESLKNALPKDKSKQPKPGSKKLPAPKEWKDLFKGGYKEAAGDLLTSINNHPNFIEWKESKPVTAAPFAVLYHILKERDVIKKGQEGIRTVFNKTFKPLDIKHRSTFSKTIYSESYRKQILPIVNHHFPEKASQS